MNSSWFAIQHMDQEFKTQFKKQCYNQNIQFHIVKTDILAYSVYVNRVCHF